MTFRCSILFFYLFLVCEQFLNEFPAVGGVEFQILNGSPADENEFPHMVIFNSYSLVCYFIDSFFLFRLHWAIAMKMVNWNGVVEVL